MPPSATPSPYVGSTPGIFQLLQPSSSNDARPNSTAFERINFELAYQLDVWRTVDLDAFEKTKDRLAEANGDSIARGHAPRPRFRRSRDSAASLKTKKTVSYHHTRTQPCPRRPKHWWVRRTRYCTRQPDSTTLTTRRDARSPDVLASEYERPLHGAGCRLHRLGHHRTGPSGDSADHRHGHHRVARPVCGLVGTAGILHGPVLSGGLVAGRIPRQHRRARPDDSTDGRHGEQRQFPGREYDERLQGPVD